MRFAQLSIFLFLALLVGCGEVPDVHPFTKATADMGAAVGESLGQVAGDLKKAAELPDLSASTQLALKNDHEQLTAMAGEFGKVAHAFDEYASALDKVAAKGQDREVAIKKAVDAANKVVAASQGFAAAVPAAGPYAAAALALKPLIGAVGAAASALDQAHTTHDLARLTSPEQEAAIEAAANLLSATVAQFAQIDQASYNILLDNDAIHGNTSLLVGEQYKRQNMVLRLVSRLVEAENLLLADPIKPGLLTNEQDAPIGDIIRLDKDPRQAVAEAYKLFSRNQASPAGQGQLLAAVQQRELYYLSILTPSQGLVEADKVRWDRIYTTPRQQSEAVLRKCQQLLQTWANSHHDLRLALLKARQVSAQDIVAQAEKVHKLIEDLKAAKTPAASASTK